MRICIISYLLGTNATGLSSYVKTLVTKLLDAGHEITVLSTNLGYRGMDPGKSVKLDPRAASLVFPVEGRANRALYRSPSLNRWLDIHVREFDVVDIQGIWAVVNADAATISYRNNVPYVLTPHGMLTRWDWEKKPILKNIFYYVLIKRLIRKAHAVRFLSKGEQDASAVTVSPRVYLIANAVDRPGEFAPDDRLAYRLKLGLGTQDRIVLFLGRISEQKGVLELVEAFEQVNLPASNPHLLLVGPTDDEAYLAKVKSRIDASAARSRIQLRDPVFGPDKDRLLRASDIFATLSRNEGLSLAALEAFAQGLPAVLTPASNLPEVQEYGAGSICNSGSPGVAQALTALLEDDERLDVASRQANRLYVEKFAWEVILPQLQTMYRDVAGVMPAN